MNKDMNFLHKRKKIRKFNIFYQNNRKINRKFSHMYSNLKEIKQDL